MIANSMIGKPGEKVVYTCIDCRLRIVAETQKAAKSERAKHEKETKHKNSAIFYKARQ